MAPDSESTEDYRYTAKQGASPASVQTFVGTPVTRGKKALITFMSVIDYTTAAKTLILGIRDAGGNDHYLRVVALASTYECSLEGPIMLLEGEAPIGVVSTPTLNDVLYFAAFGRLRPL